MAKTYTAVPSVSTGDVYTAANYNTYTATNVSNLIVPPMCKLRSSATQSIANNTDTTATLGLSDFDTDGMGTTGAGAKITISTAGVYLIVFGADFASSATGNRGIGVTKNGGGSVASASAYGVAFSVGLTGVATLMKSSVMLSLAASDYVQLQVWQSSGGALNFGAYADSSYLSAVWVGRTS